MMKKTVWVSLLGILLMGTVGCAKHTHVQQDLVAEEKLLPKLNISTPVALDAVQPKITGKDNFCRKGLGPITVEYKDLTDYAKKSASDILVRNNVQIVPAADKHLTLHIAQARCEQEAFTMNFVVDVDVTAGDMPKKTFSGNQRLWSMHGLDFTMTSATLNAVLEMFNDEEIKSYLEQ